MASEQRNESLPGPAVPSLKEAVREARIEAAERSSVVVDLRDAELARLELLNDALDPLFEQIPANVDIFDRGISKGDTPRLWIDVVAHVEMGRDKRLYRFVQDTRFGRKVLGEGYEADSIVEDVTRYVARRLVEREHALGEESREVAAPQPPVRRWSAAWAVLFGLLVAAGALLLLTYLNKPR